MEQAIVKLSQAPTAKLDVLVEASGMLYRAGRSYPLAAELLQRYLSTGPVEAAPAFKAHYLLGTMLEKQGDKTGAAREYRASLSLAGNSAWPSKRSTECPTEDAEIHPTACASPMTFKSYCASRLRRTTICASGGIAA